MPAATGPANPLDAALSQESGLRADAGVGMGAASDDDAGEPADARTHTSAAHHFELPPVTTARIETLVAPSQLGSSERAAFLDDGRFFVLGGEGIYEIVGRPTDYSAVLVAPNPGCTFGGFSARGARLYASCTNADTFTCELIVYEPARKVPLVSRALIATTGPAHFNGSAFGPDGALYVSNSLAGTDSEDPAVVRLKILKEEPLQFEQTPFVAASVTGAMPDNGGGSFPNGIRFHGDTMYLARGVDVLAVPIDPSKRGPTLQVAYTADGTFPDIDDFDIADERMWLSKFDSLRVFGLPGSSQLVVADLQGKVQLALELPFVPSHAIVSVDTLFGPACVILTSYFDGGLYRVSFE